METTTTSPNLGNEKFAYCNRFNRTVWKIARRIGSALETSYGVDVYDEYDIDDRPLSLADRLRNTRFVRFIKNVCYDISVGHCECEERCEVPF